MRRMQAMALMGTIITGCGDSKNDDDTGGVWGDPVDESGGGCEVVEETPLELDGTTPGGTPVTDIVNILNGVHEAPLTWADDTATDITVTISDVANPRHQDFEVSPDASGLTIEIACNDQVVVDIELSIVTADGQLNESLAHTATLIDGNVSPTLLVDLTEATGSFNASDWAEDGADEVTASLSAQWSENGIEGVIDGMSTSVSGEIATAMRIDIATFAAEGF
jgi:hypothetical protein